MHGPDDGQVHQAVLRRMAGAARPAGAVPVHAAVRARPSVRRLGHQAQDVPDAEPEDDEIDHHESRERAGDRRRCDGRARIGGAQQAGDDPGLATDFGRHPTRNHRDETRRPHRHAQRGAASATRTICRATARTGSTDPRPNIAKPSPTMMRNAQNTIATGGWFSRGNVSQAGEAARSRSCLRISDDSLGISPHNRAVWVF